MRCTVQGCSGEYSDRQITQTVRRRGQILVIDRVPAEVCPVCGDILLKPETVRRVEALLEQAPKPAGVVPLYEYVA
jgi:YgiT-type zinc finger domain-containing protein